MNYTATARYIRVGVRKLRLVADSIRQLSPQSAVMYLGVMPKRAADPLLNVLKSAIASAHEKGVAVTQLKFSIIEIMEGPRMKRMRPVSRGQGHGYKKRMTHVRIILTEKEKAKSAIVAKEEK